VVTRVGTRGGGTSVCSNRSGDAYFIGSADVRSYTSRISDTNIEPCLACVVSIILVVMTLDPSRAFTTQAMFHVV